MGGPVGFAAAILYTIVNALNKTLLFLSAQMRGALVGAVFVLGALSVAGMPPLAGFVGKLELFRAAGTNPVLLGVLFLGSALSFIYVLQIYQYDFWRGGRTGPVSGLSRQVVVTGLAMVVLAAGVWPEPLLAVGHDAAAVLAGGGQ